MSDKINDLIAEARRAQNAVYLATEKSVADDLARIIAGLADALEAATREPSEGNREAAFESGMEMVDWGMVRDGVGDPQEAAGIAVRAALGARAAVPDAATERIREAVNADEMRALIAEARAHDNDSNEGMRLVDRLADALSALTVPDGEVREKLRAALLPVTCNVSNYPRSAQAALLGSDLTELNERIEDAILTAFPIFSRAAVPDAATDVREYLHSKCDCVPDLGPAHCHLCGNEKGSPVPWAEWLKGHGSAARE